MATTQTTPQNAERTIEINKTRFDLDSKGDVSLRKVGKFKPVADMQEFVARLGNDSAKILQIVNDGLEEYSRREMETDSATPWLVVGEDGEIATDDQKQPVVFSGTVLSEEKAKQFNATVLNMAKMMFGYPDGKLAKNASKEAIEANRKAKQAARDAAQDFLLSNPAAVEALRK